MVATYQNLPKIVKKTPDMFLFSGGPSLLSPDCTLENTLV